MQKKEIVSMMEETRVFHPRTKSRRRPTSSRSTSTRPCKRNRSTIRRASGGTGENLDWYKKWNKVLEWDFNKPEIKWFMGGKLNVSTNCLDRHLPPRATRPR